MTPTRWKWLRPWEKLFPWSHCFSDDYFTFGKSLWREGLFHLAIFIVALLCSLCRNWKLMNRKKHWGGEWVYWGFQLQKKCSFLAIIFEEEPEWVVMTLAWSIRYSSYSWPGHRVWCRVVDRYWAFSFFLCF